MKRMDSGGERANGKGLAAVIVLMLAAGSFGIYGTGHASGADEALPGMVDGDLQQLLDQIDMELYEQSEADIRAWLDALMEQSGGLGVYQEHLGRVAFHEDRTPFSFGDGWTAEAPAMLFRAYEMLGDEKYLDAALRFCDVLVQAQQPHGHFPSSATVHADGRVEASDNMVRLQDRYQYPYFALLMYAYRLTGEEKYRQAVVKHGELMFSIQNPLEDDFWMGGWPDELPVSFIEDGSPKQTIAGAFGVRTGYAHNDYATYDGYRTMVMMYHLTGEEKYIRRIERLPQWLFDGQLGFGNVRGWNEEYGVHNEPVWARAFESTLIDPRNFNRFAGPMLVQFYAITGNEAYRNLFQESYNWLRSVEHPPGSEHHLPDREAKRGELLKGRWSYKYTYDGREAHSAHNGSYTDRLVDGPIDHNDNVHLENMKLVYDIMEEGGLDALRQWFGPRPTHYDEHQYREARIEAAERVVDEDREVVLQTLELGDDYEAGFAQEPGAYYHDRMRGNFLERVRKRLMAPNSEYLPEESPPFGATGLARRIWRPNPGRSPYKPTYGWATWQYVWDVRLALGEIDAETAARGGRGREAAGPPTTFFQPWDVRGDWTTRALEVEDWLAIPLRDDPIPVREVVLTPETMTLRSGEEQRIDVVIEPRAASYRTATWESSDSGVAAVEPRMLDEVDPEVVRPVYLTEGKMVVIAHSPGQAEITVRSTCGGHTATALVEVVEE